MQPSLFIAIDPGSSGGWVIRRPDGTISDIGAYSEPGDIVKVCAFLKGNNLSVFPIIAVIEQVWASPVMGVAAAFSFGENFGNWCMGLRVSGVPVYTVTPQAWQRVVAPDISGQGPARKRALKELAQARHPGHRVTLAIADALLISDFVVDRLKAGKEPGEVL